MAKIVRYNGKKINSCICSKPSKLVVGQEYKVLIQMDLGFQTNYILKGIKGVYNSIWFDEVSSTSSVTMAVSKQMPVVGKRCVCYKLENGEKQEKLIKLSTSPVRQVSRVEGNIYRVTTACDNIYFIQVI